MLVISKEERKAQVDYSLESQKATRCQQGDEGCERQGKGYRFLKLGKGDNMGKDLPDTQDLHTIFRTKSDLF